MATKEQRDRVDAHWQYLQPGWNSKEHGAEREMLYDVLQDGESIEALVGCLWGPENAFHANAGRFDRMKQYKGIAVVTGRRVVLVSKKGLNKLTTEMPLHNMGSVDASGEDEVTLTGRSFNNWVGHGDPAAFKMRDVQDGYARNFADKVRQLQAEPPPTTMPAGSSTTPGATIAPLQTTGHAAMSKADRIDAQWRERSTMWGRNDPGVLERLIAGLLNFFKGEILTIYPGELQILKEVLQDDENIEYWMGGRWGDATDFNTLGDIVAAAVGGLRRHEFGVYHGVVVATDRRILMLNSGMVTKEVVEVPYDGLHVDYNEGMVCSGLKFSGSTDEDYAYYLDHNGKSQIKSRARPLFEYVQRRASAAANSSEA